MIISVPLSLSGTPTLQERINKDSQRRTRQKTLVSPLCEAAKWDASMSLHKTQRFKSVWNSHVNTCLDLPCKHQLRPLCHRAFKWVRNRKLATALQHRSVWLIQILLTIFLKGRQGTLLQELYYDGHDGWGVWRQLKGKLVTVWYGQ